MRNYINSNSLLFFFLIKRRLHDLLLDDMGNERRYWELKEGAEYKKKKD